MKLQHGYRFNFCITWFGLYGGHSQFCYFKDSFCTVQSVLSGRCAHEFPAWNLGRGRSCRSTSSYSAVTGSYVASHGGEFHYVFWILIILGCFCFPLGLLSVNVFYFFSSGLWSSRMPQAAVDVPAQSIPLFSHSSWSWLTGEWYYFVTYQKKFLIPKTAWETIFSPWLQTYEL